MPRNTLAVFDAHPFWTIDRHSKQAAGGTFNVNKFDVHANQRRLGQCEYICCHKIQKKWAANPAHCYRATLVPPRRAGAIPRCVTLAILGLCTPTRPSANESSPSKCAAKLSNNIAVKHNSLADFLGNFLFSPRLT